MKNLALVLIIVFAGTTLTAAQDTAPTSRTLLPEGTFSRYYTPTVAYKVMIDSENGLVSVLDVPEGVFLNVEARKDQNPSYREEQYTYRGEIVIRLRRIDEVGEEEGSLSPDIMAKSPLEMRLTNAVVVIEEL